MLKSVMSIQAFFGFCGAGVLALLAAAAWSIRHAVSCGRNCAGPVVAGEW